MNQIRNISLQDRLQDPTQPEIWVSVEAEVVSECTEIRGRLMGPRCLFASTVEVAYALRPFPRLPKGLLPLSRRVVIPEPSLWEPECPFLYQGPIELWEAGVPEDQRQIIHGLRYVSLSAKELRVNGKPCTLKCRTEHEVSEDQFRDWRANHVNALLIPITPRFEAILALADRYGLFVIGDIRGCAIEVFAVDQWRQHPAFFGLLFDRRDIAFGWFKKQRAIRAFFCGIHCDSDEEIPEGCADFIVCSPAVAEKWANSTPPKLILTSPPDGRPLPVIPGCFGVIG